MNYFNSPILFLAFLAFVSQFSTLFITQAFAEERTMTAEQMAKLAEGEALAPDEPERPDNLVDLTKGESVPSGGKIPMPKWTLGPTGIVATFAGRFSGDQLQVRNVLKGSPADGKFIRGDVLIGMNGEKFQAGGQLAMLIGNAIIEAEKEENEGRITFMVWRDKNYNARYGRKNVASVDIDEVFAKARDDAALYDWKPEEERKEAVRQARFDEFPIDPETFEVELKLRTFPPYSDTAPYDCPKTMAILEDAWKVLERKFIADPNNKRSGRGGAIEAIALIASGKPEHRKLVREWVRRPRSPWKKPTEPIGAMFEPGYRGYRGYQSWHMGYGGLYCAIYYDATGDDYVLPALRKYAIETAMGQSGHGSWGHTFAYRQFNGGELHGMNPGYGALNAAGNRCFFLVALAQKLGIDHPEIDLAVERAQRFFSSYIDQGCIPYGDHPAHRSDDSNGKNSGVAYSLKLLGDNYGAKYFAMMSSHSAFTRRGGHGHDYHGNWSPWAANLCGPEVRAYNERNLRWRRTLCRMFDGSFVYLSPTSMTYGALRDPTATEVLHQSVIFGQTLITGKDDDGALHPDEQELQQLLTVAQGQFQDPWLKELAGLPVSQRETDELFEFLDIFYPNARRSVARKLGKRYQDGEKEIAPRLLALLESDNARLRDGALRALGACGSDTVLASLSKLTPLLKDEEDFVRITATKVISKHTQSSETQLAMLEATLDEPKAIAPNSLRNTTHSVLFKKDTPLARDPFNAGIDPEKVRRALEHLILLDPIRSTFMESRLEPWSKDTIIRVAGPLTHAAEVEQLADQMFANRSEPARALLEKFGYREALESTSDRLRRQAMIPRTVRANVSFKRPLVDPLVIEKDPGAFKELIGDFKTVLTDDPSKEFTVKLSKKEKLVFKMTDLLKSIEQTPGQTKHPALADDVRNYFERELSKLDGAGAKLKRCRAVLDDRESRDYFRKMAALDFLAEFLGADALDDFVPYLNHDYWRLREHARKLAVPLVKSGGAGILADAFQSSGAEQKAGILAAFAMAGSDAGLSTARLGLKDEDPATRGEAARALTAIMGADGVEPVIKQLSSARAEAEILAYEQALLTLRDDPVAAEGIRSRVIKLIPGSEPPVRPSLYFILGQLGDDASLATLEKAGGTKSVSELREIVLALSYSQSRDADRILLDIAATDKESAKIVGGQSARRLVLGPKGYGDVTNSERMDFVEPMLKLNLNKGLIRFLGQVHDARALRALIECLEKGVSNAAESLIANAEGMDKVNISTTDQEIALEALQDVMEYIEVTHLRGSITDKGRLYFRWKNLQTRAGQVILKLHKPKEAPIPTFDPLLIDL